MSQLATLPSMQTKRFVSGDDPTVLPEIYQEDCHLVVWQRALDAALQQDVASFVQGNAGFRASISLSSENAFASIHPALGGDGTTVRLSQDIAKLVEMFACLFDLSEVSLRLAVLGKAMCPRFHVDRVPCRLVTTYQGAATEWLPHHAVDRSKLGHGNGGLPDDKSGLLLNPEDMTQLSFGDVALLKGERWAGNEGAGLVHRSPAVLPGERRLLLTVDF